MCWGFEADALEAVEDTLRQEARELGVAVAIAFAPFAMVVAQWEADVEEITRAGEGSKIILMGDIEQIDTPYIDRYSNGLSVVIDKFKDSPLSGHIHLNRGRRSELANEANKLL